MRKLLSVLGAATLVSAPITSIVSCKAKTSGDNFYDPEVFEEGPFGDKELNKLPYQIRKMVTNTDFITKLILLGRHENLNYNINEILSMYLSPVSIAEWIPFTYSIEGDGTHGTVKGQKYSIDLGKYINGFLSNMNNLNSVVTSYNGYGGVYASYVMGMYGDDFYRNFIKNRMFTDFSDKNGDITKPFGYNAGVGLQLSADINRQNLAWGIQDTGALTNYLLTKGYNGWNPNAIGASTGPRSAPKTLTNYDGYLFYNSHLSNPDQGWDANPKWRGPKNGDGISENEKLKDSGLKVAKDKNNYGTTLTDLNGKNVISDNQSYFGSMQSYITDQGGTLNAASKINHYLSLVKNFTESTTGAAYGTTLISQMFPMVKNTQAHEGFDLFGAFISAVGEGLESLGNDDSFLELGLNNSEFQSTVKNYLDAMKISASKILKNYSDSTNWITEILMPSSLPMTIPNLMDNDSNVFDKLSIMLNKLEKISQNWNLEQKNKFTLGLMGYSENGNTTGFIANKFKNSIGFVSSALADSFFSKDFISKLNVLNLLSGIERTAKAFTNSKEQILEIGKKFTNKEYDNLSNAERMYIANQLGNVNGKYKPGSIYKELSDSFSNPQSDSYDAMAKIFYNSNAPFQTMINDQMKDIHDKFLVNAIADDNWGINNVKVAGDMKAEGSTISYTMEYNGMGDSTAKLYKAGQVQVGRNFNPYQQGNTAGPLVAGTDEEYMNYDGLGNFQDYQQVHHRYNVTWKNVSNSPDNPYWVIVAIDNFDLANDKVEQFYNMY